MTAGPSDRVPPRAKASDIARALAARIQELCTVLLPAGVREGHEWRSGDVTGQPGRSLSIRLHGDKAGVWADFATGHGGDALDLVQAVLNLQAKDAIAWSGRWLGQHHDLAEPARKTACVMARRDQDRTALAAAMWRTALPLAGTPAERYLKSRAITVTAPASLRFLDSCRHPSGSELPAMVAAVQSARGHIVAVHRTYLDENGRKTTFRPGRAMLGPCAGGAVRLAKAEGTLAIAEGIETALSVLQGARLPTWAALSTSGLRTIELPPLPMAETVILCADGDPPGEQAIQVAAHRLCREGRKIRVVRAPTGFDFNDVLQGKAPGSIRAAFA